MNLMGELLKCEGDTTYVEEIMTLLRNKDDRIFIFGAGDRAQWLGKILIREGINFRGFLVNKKYFKNDIKANMYGYEKKVYCYESIIEKEEKRIIILLGIPRSMLNMAMFEMDIVEKVIPINLGNREDYLMDFQLLEEHKADLEWLYEKLEDDYSRECLTYCLKGRLTGRDYEFEPSKWSDPEYFLEGLIEWEKTECIVDCGAYDGDTVAEFLRKKPTGNDFEYKIYAWEPDKFNYDRLRDTYKANECVICINKAAYSKAGMFGFSSDGGEMSTIMEGADDVVATDTIDRVLAKDKATFIKMDVEGSELEALKGAKEQIINNKPRLAICVYHKQEDFWTIPQYISKLNPGYKLYLRTHSSMPTELVLFCI